MIIGYARVSTSGQELAMQIDALQKAGAERIFTDKASGARVPRPGLDKAREQMKDGDVLLCWKLDRIGRSTAETATLIDELLDEGIFIRAIADGIDTSTSAGQAQAKLFSVFAEMERTNIRERVSAGLEQAKKHGVRLGRPRKLSDSQIELAIRELDGGTPPRIIAANLNVGTSTLYEAVRRYRYAKQGKIAPAKALPGRPPKLTKNQALTAQAQISKGRDPKKVASSFGVAVQTIYNSIARYGLAPKIDDNGK